MTTFSSSFMKIVRKTVNENMIKLLLQIPHLFRSYIKDHIFKAEWTESDYKGRPRHVSLLQFVNKLKKAEVA